MEIEAIFRPTNIIMVEAALKTADPHERWFVQSVDSISHSNTTYRRYLNNIRKRAGPFTPDSDEYDSANKEELKARLDFHERMKILFVLHRVQHKIFRWLT